MDQHCKGAVSLSQQILIQWPGEPLHFETSLAAVEDQDNYESCYALSAPQCLLGLSSWLLDLMSVPPVRANLHMLEETNTLSHWEPKTHWLPSPSLAHLLRQFTRVWLLHVLQVLVATGESWASGGDQRWTISPKRGMAELSTRGATPPETHKPKLAGILSYL